MIVLVMDERACNGTWMRAFIPRELRFRYGAISRPPRLPVSFHLIQEVGAFKMYRAVRGGCSRGRIQGRRLDVD